MTKNEQAINYFKQIQERQASSQDKEYLQIAIDAIEKQTQKKPTQVVADDDLDTHDCCPSCGNWLGEFETFCIDCGQYLDWSDDDVEAQNDHP